MQLEDDIQRRNELKCMLLWKFFYCWLEKIKSIVLKELSQDEFEYKKGIHKILCMCTHIVCKIFYGEIFVF